MLEKIELFNKHRFHENDTGSTAVQLILLDLIIQRTINHLNKNKKDVSAKRALLQRLAKKKRFLNYLKKTQNTLYQNLQKDKR